MLYLEDPHGIVFASDHDIASLAPEWRDRWRAVLRDGTVLHRPLPPPAGP